MRRLSLRARLTLAFAVAMAIVVTGLALFVYSRVEQSLAQTIDQGLQARAVDVANLANQADNGLSSASNPLAENFGQLIDARGAIVDGTRGLGTQPLLSGSQLARGRRHAYFLDLTTLPGGGALPGGPARVFVEPIRAQDQPLVLLIGSSLSDKQSALGGLMRGLLIGGPIALLLSALGGYLLAGAALRPVERMRARAARVSADGHGERLPVPAADDEIARLGHTLNEMLARLEEGRGRERQFLADASHELRTPLALLKTEIELALDGHHSIDELLSSLRSAGQETDRLVQLAEDLLLLAQSDKGTLPVRISPIGAPELAQRLAARFAHRAATEQRAIEIDAPADLTLLVDPLRIEQALGNLIDNALRHGAGTIGLQIARDGTDVVLHVRDQGAGIPPEFRERAFQRFTRHGSARHGHGTGLGLAIVMAIASAHGGEAAIGQRADLWLRLPAAGAAGPAGANGRSDTEARPEPPATSAGQRYSPAG